MEVVGQDKNGLSARGGLIKTPTLLRIRPIAGPCFLAVFNELTAQPWLICGFAVFPAFRARMPDILVHRNAILMVSKNAILIFDFYEKPVKLLLTRDLGER